MTNRITARAAVLVLAVATIITACGTAPTPHRPQVAPIIIVVGSASTAESEIVAAIYAGALNIRGIRATTQLNFSSRRAYVDALTQGTIALVPEDPSALFAYLKPGASPPTNLLAALRSVLPPSLDVLQPSPATPPAIPLIRKDKETAEIRGFWTRYPPN